MKEKSKIILTLDAGGTNFVFSARLNGKAHGESFTLPSNADNIDLCLNSIILGFRKLIDSIPESPDAISFAFPGPADYRNGIIGDLPNLPAFKGGVPLGPILEDTFSLPVFINNDGNLFALGESKGGFLPFVNDLLKKNGSTKIYKNLIGVTLGTGFGVGITVNGTLLEGDNSAAAEGWLLRNKHYSYTSIEDSISIRAIKRMYAEQIHIAPSKSPDPKEIYEIAKGESEGVYEAALETYLRFGEALGDAIASIITLIDGVVVIGGGVSGAYPIFSRTMMDELNGFFIGMDGLKHNRLIQKVYNLEDNYGMESFSSKITKQMEVPQSGRVVAYENEKRVPIGLSKLTTSEAVALGAYYFAVERIENEESDF